MLRSTVAYFLILVILAGTFSRSMIYAGFKVNQKYIAEKLCVNRNKPVMLCKGKCYLAKKLKQAEEQEKNEEQSSQKQRFQEAMITQTLKLNPTFGFDLDIHFGEPGYQIMQIATGIFHPPKV